MYERPDGQLVFLGRIDHQVKLRGVRIEPDEVTAVLREHASVVDAAVIARGDGDEARLAGYVVLADAATAVEQLHQFLAARLPSVMVPSTLMVLEALPLTPSGKIDREALPDSPIATSSGVGAAPRTPIEASLASLVGELLGIGLAGIHDDFFVLGGHSLLAGRLSARVRSELGLELGVGTIYRAPTVAGMAAALGGSAAKMPALTHADRSMPIPLSFPQERVWFLEKLAPGNLAYNAQATMRLRGNLNVTAMRDTLAEIVRRHEVFRTAFVDTEAGPVQQVMPEVDVRLDIIDAAGEDADKIVRERVSRPFDLASPPLARWTLIRHASDDHTLVHVEHHMVHDGWSFAVFLDELMTIYSALVDGQPHGLPEPAHHYADFAVWQRNWLRGETLRDHLDYWAAELAGSPPALTLPTDRPRPRVQGFAGDALRVQLPDDLCQALREFSRRRGVTLYTTMLAGFAALLQRYSGLDDLVIGNGVANRRLAEVERMVGMIVNTLPMRVDLSGRPHFDELIRRVHELGARVYEKPDVPLEALVEKLSPVRDPSRNPLFQAMFSFHDSAVPDLEFAGLTGTVLERHNGSAKTDLNVVVVPRAEQRAGRAHREDAASITLIWEYATDLFDAGTMRRMVGHYCQLLAAGTAQPGTAVARLPMMTDDETERMLTAHNLTTAPYPADSTICELFAAQVLTRPDAIAVVDGDVTLTYAELDDRSSRLAAVLRGRGVGMDTPVGVLLERSAEMVSVFLAVLKAGGGYVPLDPAYPTERLGWMLADVRVPVVVTLAGLEDRLPSNVEAEVIALDEAQLPAEPESLGVTANPGSLAYILYTSGSTGQPKGVMVDHRAVLRLVCGADYVAFGPGDRLAQVADASFDALTYEVWGALLNGGTVCVIPSESVLTPGRLGAQLEKNQISGMFLTSALFNEVMADYPDSFAGLSHLLVGGDVVNPGRVRQLLASDAAPARLLNGYGPTETTTFAVVHLIGEVPADAASVPIGRPIANTTVYVLDAEMHPVPSGVTGELFIGGPGVARGYARRPALTAERFVPNAFAGDGSRLYRTGDLVRWRADGVIEFIGRVDNQIKIRGYRIEPGEVEFVLGAHPGVAGAAVVVDGESSDKRLVAYVVPADWDMQPSVADLRAFLGDRLPPYLVPGVYMMLAALPLTVHGKVDRASLPRPDASRWESSAEFVAPRNDTEVVVAALCAELLGIGRVGVEDDFFALGGHSLLAMRLVSRVNRALEADVPLGQFLQTPTVAVLAAAVGSASGGASTIAPVASRRDEQLLSELDQLTDEQVEQLLSEMVESETQR